MASRESLPDQRTIEVLARVIENRHGTLHGIGDTLREALTELHRDAPVSVLGVIEPSAEAIDAATGHIEAAQRNVHGYHPSWYARAALIESGYPEQLAGAVEALRKIADPQCGNVMIDGCIAWDIDAGYRIAREWLATHDAGGSRT